MLLSEVAKISSGVLFRGEKLYAERGEYRPVIQIGDIAKDNTIQWNGLKEGVIETRNTDGVVQDGDVLVRGKGHPHFAIFVKLPPRAAMAGSQFFIVRVRTHLLLPEYLAWYLNQKPAQDDLNRHSAGTNIKQITKKTLVSLDIKIPHLDIQKKIVALYNLGQKEKGLAAQIRQKREKLLDAQLLSLTKKP